MKRLVLASSLTIIGLVAGGVVVSKKQIGRQKDGTFVVSSGQTILAGTIPFDQRLSDLALHPDQKHIAVMAKNRVFIATEKGILSSTHQALGADAGFHGIAWLPNGSAFIATTAAGHLQEFLWDGTALTKGRKFRLPRQIRKGTQFQVDFAFPRTEPVYLLLVPTGMALPKLTSRA